MSEQQIEQEDQGSKSKGMEQVSDPPTGLKTSDVYHVKNIPERFNNPGEQGGGAGDRVHEDLELFIINFYTSDWFEGYNTKVQNPFYQTSANTYG